MEREFDFNKADFHFIASLVHEKTGIVLAEHKEDMVYARIARRLRSLNLRSFRDYCSLLDDRGEEMGHFVNAVTTNMTSFFREKYHFEHLRDVVLKPMMSSPPLNRRVRLWSAACSSGAEAYSIALCCLEVFGTMAGWDVKILATDIDTKMLEKAKNGIYSEDEVAPIPAAIRKKYMQPSAQAGHFQMNEDVCELIAFKQLNLIEAWPFKGPFNAVFCRNVVIYFDKPTQQNLFENIAQRMPPLSWLYIGHSETLHGISERFEICGKTIYQRVS